MTQDLSDLKLTADDIAELDLFSRSVSTILLDRQVPRLKDQIQALLSALKEAREALTGVDADFMTSETHHPAHVLIPRAKFEHLRRASQAFTTLGGSDEQAE